MRESTRRAGLQSWLDEKDEVQRGAVGTVAVEIATSFVDERGEKRTRKRDRWRRAPDDDEEVVLGRFRSSAV
jgi:hypothetical protein